MHAKLCIIIYVVTHVHVAMYACVMWLSGCMSLIVCVFEVITDKSILILTVVVGAFRNIQ